MDDREPAEQAGSQLTRPIIGAAIDVHRSLGPGLLESCYEACLAHELHSLGIEFMRQVQIPVVYKGATLDCGFRADFIVEDSVILEIRAVDGLTPLHDAQLLTYLRLTGKRIGLIITSTWKSSSTACADLSSDPLVIHFRTLCPLCPLWFLIPCRLASPASARWRWSCSAMARGACW